MFIVINGKIQRQFDEILWTGSGIFSPDSYNFAYVARIRNKWATVINNKIGAKHDSILNFSFSPNSKSFAYEAKNNNKYSLVLDGNKIVEGGFINDYVFSSNGEDIFFTIESNNKEYIGLNNKLSNDTYDEIYWLEYYEQEESFVFLARKESKIYICKIKGN